LKKRALKPDHHQALMAPRACVLTHTDKRLHLNLQEPNATPLSDLEDVSTWVSGLLGGNARSLPYDLHENCGLSGSVLRSLVSALCRICEKNTPDGVQKVGHLADELRSTRLDTLLINEGHGKERG
jgi:hypothetical protein